MFATHRHVFEHLNQCFILVGLLWTYQKTKVLQMLLVSSFFVVYAYIGISLPPDMQVCRCIRINVLCASYQFGRVNVLYGSTLSR
jgi:hypothetical protein